MKLLICLAVVVATSFAARAAPTASQRTHEALVAGWIPIALDVHTDGTRQVIHVGARAQELRRLRIDQVDGVPLIHEIVVHYANGDTKELRVERALEAKDPSMTFELDGDGPIAALVITSDARDAASYALFGRT